MNKRIIDYKIISRRILSELQTSVKEYIDLGWQPFAGVSPLDLNLTQVMVKYEE